MDLTLAELRNENDPIETKLWSSHEWVYFIMNLPQDISIQSLQRLDDKFHFTNSGNAEILGVWFVHCARHFYEPSFGAMEQFLIHTGRKEKIFNAHLSGID